MIRCFNDSGNVSLESVCQAIADSIKHDRVDLRGNPSISAFCAVFKKSDYQRDIKVLKALGTSYSVYRIKDDFIYVQKPATKYNKEEYEMVKAAFLAMPAIVSVECKV